MEKCFEAIVGDCKGIHVRPAGSISGTARMLPEGIRLWVQVAEGRIDASSALSLLGIPARKGETVNFVVTGQEIPEALFEQLRKDIRQILIHDSRAEGYFSDI